MPAKTLPARRTDFLDGTVKVCLTFIGFFIPEKIGQNEPQEPFNFNPLTFHLESPLEFYLFNGQWFQTSSLHYRLLLLFLLEALRRI